MADDANEDEPIQPQPEPGADGPEINPPEAPEGDEDEVLISFEGEGDAPSPSEERDTGLVRHLREQLRDRERRLKALEAHAQPQAIEVGEKPSLASCDYDEDRFEQELDVWKERKAQADRQQAEARNAEQTRQETWNKKLEQVKAQSAELGAKDYDQAAEEVKATFNELQQAMIVRAAKNPAKLIYALGKSPAKAAELAKISDPVELIAELARLEGKITVTTQRKAPPPEQIARGSAPLAALSDKQLERLEKEAERSGDYSKVFAYRRQLRAQGRS